METRGGDRQTVAVFEFRSTSNLFKTVLEDLVIWALEDIGCIDRCKMLAKIPKVNFYPTWFAFLCI